MEIGCFQNHSVSWLLRWGSGIQDDDSDEGGWKRRFDDSFIENMNNEKGYYDPSGRYVH